MYSIFEKLLEERGVKVSDVSRATGIRQSIFSDWKAGRYTPKTDKMKLIADYFGVSVEYLLTGDTSNQSEFTARNEEERRLLVLFRNTDSVPEEEREEIIRHFESTVDIYLKAKGIIK